MKKLLNLLKLDFRLILRDKIALYMALAPALLSIVYLAVIGNMSEGTVKLGVSAEVPPEVVQRLEAVAEIEIIKDRIKLEERVKGADSIAGLYMDGDRLIILVEGNEKAGFAEKNRLLLDRALSDEPVTFQSVRIETTENLVMTIAMASVLLLGILIAGAVSGFNIVHERESGVIRALAVSPTGLAGYLGSRTLTALVLGILNVALSTFIMGKAVLVPGMISVALASVFICAIIAILMGALADNLIASFAVMKVLMPLCLALPIVSVFVPERFRFLFYPLPMYWQYESMIRVLEGSGDALPLLMVILTGALWFIPVYLLCRKAFQFKMKGVGA